MNPTERAYWVQRVLDTWALHGNRWVQGTYAATRGGLNVSWAHPAARAFCLSAAIEHVAAENLPARRFLYRELIKTLRLNEHDPFALEHWNDADGRTFADVREALEQTVYRLMHGHAGVWV